jgi:hypothetical protein
VSGNVSHGISTPVQIQAGSVGCNSDMVHADIPIIIGTLVTSWCHL